MQTPFSAAQFFNVFAQYNHAVWPVQIILIGLALAAVLLAARAAKKSLAVTGLLAGFWVWMGVAYHLVFFARITPLGFVFSALFVLEGISIAWHGLRTRRLVLAATRERAPWIGGWVLIGYSLIAYPVLALAFGQRYPAMPTFGLPCPTTIFTLGVFLWCRRPVPWSVLVVPGLWALVATSAAANFGVIEDYALPLAAAVLFLTREWPRKMAEARAVQHSV